MAKDSIGIIFGKTGTHDFRFAVPNSSEVKRTDYVKVWHEKDGWTLAQVTSMTRSSDDFKLDEAADLAGGAKVESPNSNLVADATVIGSRGDDGLLRSPRTPFIPGDKVFTADHQLIRSTLGLSHGDVYMGLLEGHEIKVSLDMNSLIQKHCSILAKTGSGKSYTAAVILEEILEQDVPLLIIDPHGEYHSLKEQGSGKQADLYNKFDISPRGYGSRITVYTPANKVLNPAADEVFRLDGMNLTPNDLIQILPDEKSSNMQGILFEAINKIRAEMEHYSLDDIIFEVGNSKSKLKWNVIASLESIRDVDILSDKPTTLDELFSRGRAAIIDMKGVAPQLQSMIVAKLCSDLFEARKMGNAPPGMLVVEEAHNFCPERGFDKTQSTEILRTIASEGRKFGLGMMVISQRPARVDKNVLSQCNTQIIMKMTNPNDLKAISKGLEGVSSEVEEELKRLPPGVAMLVSNDIEQPILVDIRVRKSKHGGESVNIAKPTSHRKTSQKDVKRPSGRRSSPDQQVRRESPPKSGGGGLFKKVFGSNK
ncbi:MAG: ATP-binding protein [Methanosarcinales archaeon]|nr:ATP-binding protein [Methanosarcinales archaeon]